MPTRALFSSDRQQEGLNISSTVVPPVSAVPFQGRQPPEAGAPIVAWHALQTNDITRFRAEGMAVDEKQKCCLADSPVPRHAVESVFPMKSILDSGSGISTMSECGRKVAGRRSRRSDRGTDDRRPMF